MLADLDETIRRLLVDELPVRNGEIETSFDQPKRDWSSRISKPTINIFMYDVRENNVLRRHQWERMNGNSRRGAGAGGYALGRLLDQGVGALDSAITGGDQGDCSLSGGLASLMTSADQGMSGLFADPDRPAYTQTLGWKLGEWLGV